METKRQRPCWEIGLLVIFPWLLLFEAWPHEMPLDWTIAEPKELDKRPPVE